MQFPERMRMRFLVVAASRKNVRYCLLILTSLIILAALAKLRLNIVEVVIAFRVRKPFPYSFPAMWEQTSDSRPHAGGQRNPHIGYKVLPTAVTSMFGDDPRIYTFTGNSTKKISERLFPEIGNGHVATQIGNNYMFMSGLYSGFEIKSARAAIPSTVGWHVVSQHSTTDVWEYILDTARGVFVHRCKLQGAQVEMRTYARRDVPSVIVREIHATNITEDIRLQVKNPPVLQSDGLQLETVTLGNLVQMHGVILASETNDSGKVHVFVVYDDIPSEILLTPESSSVFFITSVNQNVETAWREYDESRSRVNELYPDHVSKWLELWKEGRITTTPLNSSNILTAQVTQASQYYLLTSSPWPKWNFSASWPFFGLSPGGLAHGMDDHDYMGHVFWDQETWMYPALMPFHPKLAQHMSDYRFYTLPKAIEKAKTNGWQGAQYPWESAFTGMETSPWNFSANNEQHVVGDISYAISQFLWMKDPKDKVWYLDKGKEIIEEIARFWGSRLYHNAKYDRYEIYNVMPPDEYVHCANNSAFTNYIAAFSLRAPQQLAKYFHETPKSVYATWSQMADKIYIPLNTTEPQYHPEFDGYKLGTVVKQADVILLGYPMQFSMSPWLRRNDLDVYEEVTDMDGPAMTWSMFAVGRLELQQYTEAWTTFKRSFDFVRDPFKVWTEVRSGDGAVNFATGMGGFLQSIVNGYVGLRIYPDSLRVLPTLPPDTQCISLYGVKYRGVSLDFTVQRNPDQLVVRLLVTENPAVVNLMTTTQSLTLSVEKPVLSLPWKEIRVTVVPLQ